MAQGMKFVLSTGATVVLARLLTPQDYGLIGMMAVVVGFVSMFKDLGLATATIQREQLVDTQVSTLFWVNTLLSVAVTVVTASLAPLVAWLYGESRLTAITAVYSVGFIFGGLAVQHEALLRRQMRFVALGATEVISLIAGIVVAIILASRGWGYWALIFSQLTQGLTYMIGVWVACDWRPGLPARGSGVRSLLVFGRNLTGFSIINYFSRNLDNMLIGKFWGSYQLGLYAKAYQLLLLPIEQINTPISAVAVPALSRLVEQPERYRQAYLRLLRKVALLTMPAVALMIAGSDWIVSIVLGNQWAPAATIFSWLGIAGLFQPVAGTSGWLFMTQSRTHHMLQWGLIGGTMIIIAICAGLPWGPVGVAASYSLTFVLVVMPGLFWFAGRTGPVRTADFYRALAPFVLASMLALAGCLLGRRATHITNPIAGLSLCVLVVVCINLAVLALLPSGRAALLDIKAAAMFLLPHRKAIE